MKRALTLGSFDPLHAGHLGLFAQCRRIADELVVAVNCDQFIYTYKGHLPFMNHDGRMALIGALSMVDDVCLNLGDEFQPALIDEIAPDVIVVGEDWAKRNYVTQLCITQDWLDDRGIQLVYVPRTGDWSSSALKATA